MRGIYIIRCLQEPIVYIGSSTDIERRWIDHKRQLSNNTHKNAKLQLAWDAYGDESFIFEVLEETLDIIIKEQDWIDKFWPNCYNISRFAYNPMADPNTAAKQQKALNASGKRGNQKLSETDVIAIVNMLNKGYSLQETADAFKVSKSLINGIASGYTWVSITDKIGLPIKRRKRVSEEDKQIIKEQVLAGVSLSAIGKTLGYDYTTIKSWAKKLGVYSLK